MTIEKRLLSLSIKSETKFNDSYTLTIYSDGLQKFESNRVKFFLDNGLLISFEDKENPAIDEKPRQKSFKQEQASNKDYLSKKDFMDAMKLLSDNLGELIIRKDNTTQQCYNDNDHTKITESITESITEKSEAQKILDEKLNKIKELVGEHKKNG